MYQGDVSDKAIKIGAEIEVRNGLKALVDCT